MALNIGVSPTNCHWFPLFVQDAFHGQRNGDWGWGQQPGLTKIHRCSLKVQINIACGFKILTLPKRQKREIETYLQNARRKMLFDATEILSRRNKRTRRF